MSIRVCVRGAVRALSGIGVGACSALALVLALPAGPAVAAAPAGAADVREAAGGVPCFTIAEQEERRHGAPSFQAISVTDLSSKPQAPMWSMAMPAERTFPLMFSMCVPYAGRVPSLPQQHAEPLEAGRWYAVSIEVRPDAQGAARSDPHPAAPAPPAPPRFYAARFCLLRQADGSKAVRMADAGVRAVAPCGGAAATARPLHKRAAR